MECPVCGEENPGGAQWCEACGASMDGEVGAVDGPPCVDCGALHAEIVDGYCGVCGRKQPAARDHVVEDLGAVVAVTDRGLRHHTNEDAFAIGRSGDALVAVACDGVSTTDNPQDVSLAAALAARDHLVAALDNGETDMTAALAAAVDAAQAAAAEVPENQGGQGPGSATFVASVIKPSGDIVRSWTAWLGDSRAYWLHDGQATQLTADDVWWRDQVREGLLSDAEAKADARAQSITRWLGADAVDAAPTIQEFEHDPGGMLLLCSDGLWKYTPTAEDLATKIDELVAEGSSDARALAEGLVAFALECGGHDNTTVVIARSASSNAP